MPEDPLPLLVWIAAAPVVVAQTVAQTSVIECPVDSIAKPVVVYLY